MPESQSEKSLHICHSKKSCHKPDTVSSMELVARRICPQHLVYDENRDEYRPSTAAFTDDSHGGPMSVGLLSVESADEQLVGYRDCSLVEFAVGFFRSEDQSVCPWPTMNNKSHAHVCGEKTKARRKRFAVNAKWAVKNFGV